MPRNTLVINCDIRETRVALIEGGVIGELQIERASSRGTVGNIVLGRVTRVLPGMQAAFIDVGMERAAFLHVEDLIRPDDFEAYLAGARRHDEGERWNKGEGGRRRATSSGPGKEDDDDDDDEDLTPESVASESRIQTSLLDRETEAVDLDDDAELGDEEEEEEEEEEGEEQDVDPGEDDDPEAEAATLVTETEALVTEVLVPPDVDVEGDDEPLLDNGDEDEVVPGAAKEAGSEPDGASSRRKRRRRRRRGREAEGQTSSPVAAAAPVTEARREEPRREEARKDEPRKEESRKEESRKEESRREVREKRAARAGRDARGSREARESRESRESRETKGDADARRPKGILRVSRSVPITEVVKEGDEVIVQISKEPIGTKGARVTSHVSLPGRYVVYLPTVDHVGVSKRIGSARERTRLRQVVDTLKPPTGGIIVRTLAEGLTKKDLKSDIGYLVRLWEDVLKKRATGKAPCVLYTELDLVLKTARDLFTDEIESIVIDDKAEYARLVRFVEMFLPARVKDIHYYAGDEPIFDAYGIEDEISRALSRKVPLPSGGYLIIDQAEALTAIDVNTGRFVGKGSKDLEETALKTNLEAVEEIAYQLRFRNIGGLVILDLIDMDVSSNREKVWRALEQRLAKDKAKTTINRISELGLIEMTRKRTRESLTRTMHETCFYCDGTGQIQSRGTIAYEILRQIRRERHNLQGYSVVVNAHPAVVDLMTGEEREAVAEAERRYMRRIEFNPRREYHIEQFDLQGK
ncbi:MAG TPA: Rne/Rng family ribonuclease [Polyangiaceae bacterium]|nr:Rne/Rng family ribonuclease [Polyangiaceae bacterium]